MTPESAAAAVRAFSSSAASAGTTPSTIACSCDSSTVAGVARSWARSLADSDGRGRFITLLVDGPDSETTVRFVPYPAFQQSYLTRGVRGPGQPGNFTILPNGRLRFDLIADRPYTVKINYRRRAQRLVDNGDEPRMPDRHHMAIVWWAIVRYYCVTRDGAERFRAKAKIELDREMQILYNEQVDEAIMLEGLE